MKHKIKFADAKIENGKIVETKVRMLKASDLVACPHVIFDPTHYRADGSCRCNDKNHKEMESWGYRWKNGQWR